jgi:hypothetical protein
MNQTSRQNDGALGRQETALGREALRLKAARTHRIGRCQPMADPLPAQAVVVRVAVHQPSPDRTQAVWLDSAHDLSSTDSTQEYPVD